MTSNQFDEAKRGPARGLARNTLTKSVRAKIIAASIGSPAAWRAATADMMSGFAFEHVGEFKDWGVRVTPESFVLPPFPQLGHPDAQSNSKHLG